MRYNIISVQPLFNRLFKPVEIFKMIIRMQNPFLNQGFYAGVEYSIILLR